ncbi:hypothetical protein EBT31_02610 [bacterium]|jgi:hypothetical protein|nr:hypothetical protein [bacterium]
MPTVNSMGRAYIRAFLVENAADPSCCQDQQLVDSLAAACEASVESCGVGYVALAANRTASGRVEWCQLPSWALSYAVEA